MHWIFWIIIAFVMMRIMARRGPGYGAVGCGRGRMGIESRRHSRRPQPHRASLPPRAVVDTPESRMQTLQRQYVEGAITVEQYEHEVDRLIRTH